mgnify:CR=1 FL=1
MCSASDSDACATREDTGSLLLEKNAGKNDRTLTPGRRWHAARLSACLLIACLLIASSLVASTSRKNAQGSRKLARVRSLEPHWYNRTSQTLNCPAAVGSGLAADSGLLKDPLLPSRQNQTTHLVSVALLALGRAATEPQLLIFLHSIRTRGQWRGNVFVYTDCPECIPRGLATAVPLAPARDKFDIKVAKQLVLQCTAATPYTLYSDSDVVVGLPLGDFLTRTIAMLHEQKRSIAMGREIDRRGRRNAAQPHNGGRMFFENPLRSVRTRRCLDAWFERLLEKSTNQDRWGVLHDQLALGAAVRSKRCMIADLPKADGGATAPELNRGSTFKRTSTFAHVTRTGTVRYSSREYLTMLGTDLMHLSSTAAANWWTAEIRCPCEDLADGRWSDASTLALEKCLRWRPAITRCHRVFSWLPFGLWESICF